MTAPARISEGPTWWPVALLRGAATHPGIRRVAVVWVLASALAVALALLEAEYNWSGLPVRIGSLTLAVSIYPPLLVTLLLAVWLGPGWAAIPAYLSTVASALYNGVSWPLAALFGMATPVELIILWGSMALAEIDPELRSGPAFLRYLAAGFIAALGSSLAGLIWIDSQQLDLLAGQRIWQGWIIGDLIQIGLIAPPILRLAGPAVRGWLDRQMPVPPRDTASYSGGVALLALVVLLMAAMVFQGVALIFESLGLSPAMRTASGEPLLDRLREVMIFMGLLVLVAVVTTTAFASFLARVGERERRISLRDPLTGALNRRAFGPIFEREADRSKRLGRGISVIFFDVDQFKPLNDSYGHDMGDEVLRQLVRRVQSVTREHDVLFRWGGEEFVVLLPHTEPADAPGLAERIRVAVAARPLVEELLDQPIRVTISLGTAGSTDHAARPDALITRADLACYAAKSKGRNRVEPADALPQSA